jgi:hypothetical protein
MPYISARVAAQEGFVRKGSVCLDTCRRSGRLCSEGFVKRKFCSEKILLKESFVQKGLVYDDTVIGEKVTMTCVQLHQRSTSTYVSHENKSVYKECLSFSCCLFFFSLSCNLLFILRIYCLPISLLASVFCSAFAHQAFACLSSLLGVRSSSVRSSPRHLSKWSHALVPVALVYVVARPRPHDTCLSGRTPSSPRHLSKWSYALVPTALVKVVAHPRPRNTCLSGHAPSSPRDLL